jgi:NifB/MoaA-like Fe-S oxidoreductase
VTERLSPLYVSIHATDPDVRTRLLRNRRGAVSLRWLGVLLDAGIEVHGQIVVCPGINDGDVLDDTLLGVLDRFPRLATIGVVPLGVSAHNHEPEMRPHTRAEAEAVLDTIERWQQRYLDVLGRRLVYASDEYYLQTDRPFPAFDAYDGMPQHENGIGMARTFEAEVRAALAGAQIEGTGTRRGFFAWVDGAPADGYRAPRTSGERPNESAGVAHVGASATEGIAIVTGAFGARVLEPLLDELRPHVRVPVRLVTVENAFFGGNIGVTGLLTGADVAAALEREPAVERYLLPDVVLSRGAFLDGTTVDQLPRRVDVVPTDGASLVRALV